jgi:signal transduction histidine kinase
VLVVDPSDAAVSAVIVALEPLAVPILHAHSMAEAAESISRGDVAVVLIEVGDAGATDLIRGLDSAHRGNNPGILLMSSSADALLDAGVSDRLGFDFVAWPNDPAVLRAKVSLLLHLGSEAPEVHRLLLDLDRDNETRRNEITLVAHELRTPIGVIAGYVSMLNEGTVQQGRPGWDLVISGLLESTSHLQRLVDDLLTASRVEANRVEQREAKVPLTELAENAAARARPQARLVQGMVTAVTPILPVQGIGDPRHIAKILDNLVNNALSYAGDRPRVVVRVSPGPPPVIDVEDNGPGIPAEMRGRIFERFVRATRTDGKEPPGTGLGLYIARQLAEGQGGSLTLVQSTPGGGSTFRLTLRSATG